MIPMVAIVTAVVFVVGLLFLVLCHIHAGIVELDDFFILFCF
jgi:hypothetical protein